MGNLDIAAPGTLLACFLLQVACSDGVVLSTKSVGSPACRWETPAAQGGEERAIHTMDGGGFPTVAVDECGDVLLARYTGYPNGGMIELYASDDSLRWSRPIGASESQGIYGVAVDPGAGWVIAGEFEGTLDLGDKNALVSAGGQDAFVAKLDLNGNVAWSRRFGDPDKQVANSIAVDAVHNVVVTGLFHGAVDFGAGSLTSAGGPDVFVLKLDPQGNTLWARSYGDAAVQSGKAVAIDAAGRVLVAGGSGTEIDFGGGPLPNGAFLAVLDADGNHLWSRAFSDTAGAASGFAVAADASGGVAVAGGYRGDIDAGNQILTSDLMVGSGFLVNLDHDGQPRWSTRISDAQAYSGAILVDARGDLVISAGAMGGASLSLSKYGPDGTPLWGRSYPAYLQPGPSVGVDTARGITLTGTFAGPLQFAGKILDAKADGSKNNIFWARFGP